MSIFTSARFTWWQLGILKWATLLIGIAIGSYWPEVFAPYAKVLLAIGAIAGLYLWFVWARGT